MYSSYGLMMVRGIRTMARCRGSWLGALALTGAGHALAEDRTPSTSDPSPVTAPAETAPAETAPAASSAAPAPAPEPAPPAPPPSPAATPPAPKGPTAPRPPGTLELRIQTVSNVAGAGALALTTAPGFAYDLESGNYVLNIVAGVGYFLSPYFALGLDASYTHAGGDADATLVTVAPFAKLVTGQERFRPGFFTELSPGWAMLDESRTQHFFQLSGWLGAHVPLSSHIAMAFGPSTIFITPFDGRGQNVVLVGVRIGLSAYLP